MDIIGFEKSSIATAVIHRFGGEIAAKFGERFRHDSGEPDDAAHFEVFGREGAGVECVGCLSYTSDAVDDLTRVAYAHRSLTTN